MLWLELVGRIELDVILDFYGFLLFGPFWSWLIIPINLVLSFIFHLVLSRLDELTVSLFLLLDALRGPVILPHHILPHLWRILEEVWVGWGILILSEVSWSLVVSLCCGYVIKLLIVCHKILNLGQRLLMLLMNILRALCQVLSLARVGSRLLLSIGHLFYDLRQLGSRLIRPFEFFI